MSLFRQIGNYFSLVKFAHTLFALPFALAGFFFALEQDEVKISWRLLGLVILCMVLARNTAMGFNRWADRTFDASNPRTAGREIPAGVIRAEAALVFCLANAALFMLTTWFINMLCFFLSPVALAVIMGYSLTKRFTSLSHLFLGLGLSLAPTGAYISVSGRFNLLPVLLSLAVLFWVAGFDIIYALQDEDFDRSQKLRSIPAKLGQKKALLVAAGFHLITSACIVFTGFLRDSGILYWIAAGIFILLIIRQHTLVRPGRLGRINAAFFTTNSIASIVYAILVIFDIYI